MATESYLMTASDFSRDKDLQYAVSKHTTTIKQQPTTFGAACVRISLARDLCCEKKLRSLSVVCETCVGILAIKILQFFPNECTVVQVAVSSKRFLTAQNRATLVPSCTSMCVGACYETGSNNNDIIIAEGTYKGITNSNNVSVHSGNTPNSQKLVLNFKLFGQVDSRTVVHVRCSFRYLNTRPGYLPGAVCLTFPFCENKNERSFF